MAITHIPVAGGSGLTPTGAMQFQDDWPGLFIRGKDALRIAGWIRHFQQRLADDKDHRTRIGLQQLTEIADIIEREVIVRREQQ
jgi:hypothetical protein